MEQLRLRHFGSAKPSLRQAGAPRGLTRDEQEALLADAVRGHVADERRLLRCPRTVANIDRAQTEFSEFLLRWRTHPSGHWGACTPELVLIYLRNIVSARAGRGGSGLAASTLRQYVSNLSSCFCKLGRSEPWDDLARCGNPVASQLVRNHVEMVERGQHAAGRRECSAQPIPRAAVIQLLRHLDEAAAAALRDRDQLEQLRCARDSALVALLWHSCRRGADLLRMHWCHAYAQGTRSLLWFAITFGAETVLDFPDITHATRWMGP